MKCLYNNLFGFMLFLSSITALYAEEYTVTNAGELEALPSLQAGDVVILESGTYDNVDVTLGFNGTAENPILVYANPAGGARFTGGTSIILDGQHATIAGLDFNGGGGPTEKEGIVKFEQGSEFLTLHNCQFKDFDAAGTADANWVFMEGYNNKITYCSFEGKTSLNSTIFIKPTEEGDEDVARNHHIVYCYFGPRTEIGNNGYESIRVSDSGRQDYETRCLIAYNYFYQAISADNASEMEVISNKSRGNIYRGNILEECDGQITIRHGRDCVVEENYIIGTGGTRQSGIRIIGTGHIVRNNFIKDVNGDGLRSAICIMDGEYGRVDNQYEGVENTLIEGNVIIDCKVSANFGESQGFNDPPIDSIFRNNKILNSNGRTLFEIQSDATFEEVSGNEVYTNSSSLGDTAQLTGGYNVNQNLDQSVPFVPVIHPDTAADQTGHDFSRIFIDVPDIPEIPEIPETPELTLPIEITRDENSSTLHVEATSGEYLNVYISSDLDAWSLYSPVTQATNTGINAVSIMDSNVLDQELTPDLTKVFYRVDVDSVSHESAPPVDSELIENGGEIVIQAEAFTTNTQRDDGAGWVTGTTSGEDYVQAGSGSTSTWSNGSELSYTVQFNTPGTYYIHPRFIANTSSEDSFFVGLNGSLVGQINTGVASSWAWDNNETEGIVIPSAGAYQIQIRRREGGMQIDQFILTNDAGASF